MTNTPLRLLVVTLLVGALTGVSEGKVKPKGFGLTAQTESSIAIDPAGFPHIAYQGVNNNLYYARFDGRTRHRELVDLGQYYGNAMAINSRGAHSHRLRR